jgi:hypothetical protein
MIHCCTADCCWSIDYQQSMLMLYCVCVCVCVCCIVCVCVCCIVCVCVCVCVLQFPFDLDPFQKEAIYHVENGESVFVAAHTSAGIHIAARS